MYHVGQLNAVQQVIVNNMAEGEIGWLTDICPTCATLVIHTNQDNCHKCAV